MSGWLVLEQHTKELADKIVSKAFVQEQDGRLYVVIPGYHLPSGAAAVPQTDILFVADSMYPLSAMDMFYTRLDVIRPDGSSFENSDTIEPHLGQQWRRFSYHRNGTWNPSGNPLLDHYAFMETRWTAKALR